MSEVRARVWATKRPGGRCWHYEVTQLVMVCAASEWAGMQIIARRAVKRVIARGDSADFEHVLSEAVHRVRSYRALLDRHPDIQLPEHREDS